MGKFVIHGGRKLFGEVFISGSKNAALPILASTLLTKKPCLINNLPLLKDVQEFIEVLKALGTKVVIHGNLVLLDSINIGVFDIIYRTTCKIRASVLLVGPLLTRFGAVRISLPGGCSIGVRPINMHLKAFLAMGAIISISNKWVDFRVPGRFLVGCHMVLDIASVGVTENIILAASLASGITTIENAAREPEIIELARVLNSMGANIKGAGSSLVQIKGVKSLDGINCFLSPDRIETGTYIAATAVTHGNVRIRNSNYLDLESIISKFIELGCKIKKFATEIHVKGLKIFKPVKLFTYSFPGFPSDMQAQFMACMLTTRGNIYIEERIWENRFLHCIEFSRMGANIIICNNIVVLVGVENLREAPMMTTDLRASAGLIIAALASKGKSVILNTNYLDRGYVAIDEKLRKLNADIVRL